MTRSPNHRRERIARLAAKRPAEVTAEVVAVVPTRDARERLVDLLVELDAENHSGRR